MSIMKNQFVLLSLVIALFMVLTPIAFAQDGTTTFTDVPETHHFHGHIEAMVEEGITEGYYDGTFRPANNITRMAMAAFLVRALELEGDVPEVPTFNDVPSDHDFFDEIEILAASGITTGYEDGTFRPTNNVTRMAMAAFLYRGLELEDAEVTAPSFTDVPEYHQFLEEVEALAASGITTGYEDGTFRPTNNVTRMAVAAFLARGLIDIPMIDGITEFKSPDPEDLESIEIAEGVSVEAAAGELLLSLKFDITEGAMISLIYFLRSEHLEVIGYSSSARILQVKSTSDLVSINEALINRIVANTSVISAVPNLLLDVDALDVKFEDSAVQEKDFVDQETTLQDADQSTDNAPLFYQDNPVFKSRTFTLPTWTPSDFLGDWWIEAINAPAAWARGKGAGTTIGIVDSSISATGTIAGERLTIINEDSLGGSPVHGQRVTGLAAADGTDDVAVGMAWESPVVFAPWRLFAGGSAFSSDINAAIEDAIDSGARIVNVSAGPVLSSWTLATNDNFLQARRNWRLGKTPYQELAAREDILITWSAGNDGFGYNQNHFPTIVNDGGDIINPGVGNYVPETTVRNDNLLLPVGSDASEAAWNTNALIVGAAAPGVHDSEAPWFANTLTPFGDTDNYTEHPFTDGRIAQFSRLGDVVDLMAPGLDVSHNPDFAPSSGTSFAAPLVAGSAAVTHSINSELYMAEVRRILVDSADPTPFIGSGEKVGSGLLDAGEAAAFAHSTLSVPTNDLLEAVFVNLGDTETFEVDITVPESGVTALDVVFCVDVSGSYGSYIHNFKALAVDVVDELSERVDDLYVAMTSFSDFPISPYGSAWVGDEAYYLNQRLTGNTDLFYSAVDGLTIYSGADLPESQLEALYQIATGAGRDISDHPNYMDVGNIAPSSIGWRPGALRVIIIATDATFHDSDENPDYPGAGFEETIAALNDQNIMVLGLHAADWAIDDLQRVADATGGVIFPSSLDGSTLVEEIAGALDEALTSFTVSIDPVNDFYGFIQNPELLRKTNVEPGTTVQFEIEVKNVYEKGVSGADDSFKLIAWALVGDSGLIKRIPITITLD